MKSIDHHSFCCNRCIQVRLTAFSEASVSVWFAILEAQFELAHITQSNTKFFHALSVLSASLINRLSPDILVNKNYTELKSAVLALVEKTKPELFESLSTADSQTGRPSVCLLKLDDRRCLYDYRHN